MKNAIILSFCSILLFASCSTMKVSERRPDGYFYANKSAKMVKAEKMDLAPFQELLIVPNSDYMKGMAKNINFFKEVKTIEEFEKDIILAGKAEEIGDIQGQIGLNKAYNNFRKFLYLRFDSNTENGKRIQLKLVRPDNLEDIFVAETKFDTVWAGVYDANTFNPLFNSLITFIELNSRYRKTGQTKK